MTSVIKDLRCTAQDPADTVMARQSPTSITRPYTEARCLRTHQCTAAPFNTTRAEGEAPSGWDQRRLLANPSALHPTINWN